VCTEFWWRNLREKDHLGDQGINYRIILRCIFRKCDVGAWTGSSWLRIGTGGGKFKCGNERSGSIKCVEFHDQLRTGQLLKTDCAPWRK